MRILILANGDRPSASLLENLKAACDLFIATDGAANDLAALGIAPDVILGDFDSLAPDARDALASSTFIPATDQDASDLDKALAYALLRGATEITITGAGGGRIDHTLTNVSLLLKYGSDIDLRIVDDRSECRAVWDRAEIHGEIGDTLSLIVFAPAEGVTLEGAEWPLHDATLTPGSLGVSNVVMTKTVRVSVDRGVIVVCHLPLQRRPPD